MDLKDLRVQWEHLELDLEIGLRLSSLLLPPRLLPPFHILLTSPPSHLPRAQARPQRPARATDHPTPAMGVPQQGKRPAALPQTHNLKAQGTDWGPSPAPWGWEVGWTGGMGRPVQEKLVPNSNQ